jgi:hypothetical protein
MKCKVREREQRWVYRKFANPVMKSTIGYGFYPLRVLRWWVSLILLGFFLYAVGYDTGSIVPTNKENYDTFRAEKINHGPHKRFHALFFSAENNIPFVKLGQSDQWQPDPEPSRFIWRLTTTNSFAVSIASALQVFQWFQVLSGWILGSLFLAGLTGVVRSQR